MTGFGAAEGSVAGGRLRVEIRTVNHRYFNLSIKLPPDLAATESDFRETLRKEFERGHVSVSVRWVEHPVAGESAALNLDRARVVLGRLQELKTALALPGEIDLALIARQPEVFGNQQDEAPVVAWSEVGPVVSAAVAACQAMRQREGTALSGELTHRLELLETAARVIAARAPERIVRERDRLRGAVLALLEGKPADEDRVAQEIAFLADRLDITEELVRFAAHIAGCREVLVGQGPKGKQLGFLAQELGREVNTMGSKANDAVITQQVLLMKGELEKFREQLENLA